jgi:uncharacterized repeat protein (TIGR01451 family)
MIELQTLLQYSWLRMLPLLGGMMMKTLNWNIGMKARRLLGMALLLSISSQSWAVPGQILFQDDFERSNPGVVGNGWTVTAAANACTGTGTVAPTATITIAGSQKVPVNGITVAGQQIMKAAYAGNTSPNTVATNIINQINACSNGISGACTVAGYSASRNNNVVTITGPSSATGTPVVQLGTPSGNGTAETFAATTFTGSNTGCAGIDADTPPWNNTLAPRATNYPNTSPLTKSMFTRWATVTVDTPVVDLSGRAAVQVTYWVRRGSDCFSEWPGNNSTGCNAALQPFTSLLGEEFQTQYKNSAGAWVVLSQFPTDAIPGEIFRPVIDLPADALWSGFQLRFRQPGGSGDGNGNNGAGAPNVLGYDYWHVDDVKITEVEPNNTAGAFCDTFEADLGHWTFTGTGNAAIGSKYFQNGLHDLDIRWGAVTVTSKPTDMTNATGKIEYWVKRGVGSVPKAPNTTGSDLPDAGKDLVIEYLAKNAGVLSWKPLVPAATFTGSNAPTITGQVWDPVANPTTNSKTMPLDANLAAFQLRFRLLAGAGYDQDYWHVDDVCLGTVVTGTDLELILSPTGTTTLAPGAATTITFTITNKGPNVEPGNISIIDTLPTGLSFVSNGNWSSGTWSSTATGCTTVGQVLTCTRAGTLAVNASTTLTITVQADANASGTISNSAIVGSSGSQEIAPLDNTKSHDFSFSASAFEAYETSTTAGAISGRIYTKLASTPFDLKVIAINSSAINANYNKAPTVDLIDGSLSCVAATAALTGVTVTPSPYTYVAGDSGAHTYTFTSTKAYPNVKVRVKDNTPSVGCSSDNFAIRPSAFTITSTANNNDSSGASIIAGTAFTINAASVAGYNGIPVFDNTTGMVIGSPVAGTIGGVFTAAAVATGTASGASFTYSEVGNFGLNSNAVYDSKFTLVDQSANDCVATSGLSFANTADANGQYGCSIGSIGVAQTTGSSGFGRFIPDYFTTEIVAVAGVPMTCPALPFACPANTIGASGMLYSGQPFTVKVTARNAAGVVTNNYQGGYAKAVTLGAWDAADSTVTANPGGGTLAPVTASAFSLGVSQPTETYSLPVFTGTPTVAPTNFFIRATDTENVTSLLALASGSAEAGLKVAYGQIKVSNGYGSELLPLTLTATVQYYAATGWVKSLTDSATNLTFATSYGVGTGTTTPTTTPANGTMSNGSLSIKLSKPGVKGVASILPGKPSYLPINTATATFGIYKGSNEFIYLREAY